MAPKFSALLLTERGIKRHEEILKVLFLHLGNETLKDANPILSNDEAEFRKNI